MEVRDQHNLLAELSMFELFIKAISPFFIFLGLIFLYGYATGQNSQELIEAVINLISTIVRNTAEVFDRN
ncbi:MAG: chromosome replication initiation inhibitor protein [Moritella sp.]|nr:chromosome replication initiation inhibitor protein [Moritella sp.]